MQRPHGDIFSRVSTYDLCPIAVKEDWELVGAVVQNSDLKQQFEVAARLKYGSKLAKIPLALKFMDRAIFERSIQGSPRRARLFFGTKMKVILPEVVSTSIYTYGYFDDWVTTFVLNDLKPGDTFIDAGAHFGFFSLLASKIVGPTGSVLAIEPTPSTFRVLSENCAPHGNIKVVNVALGREAGSATINDFGIKYSAWNFMGSEHRATSLDANIKPHQIEVPVVTIDQLAGDHQLAPSMVKIDTENFEEEVVAGMADVIRRNRPSIILEAMSEFSDRVGKNLYDRGYAAFARQPDNSISRISENWSVANRQHTNVLFKSD